MASCVKEADETILVNDPQQIRLLNEWPADLLELYGEENVCFGDVPPIVDCGFKANHKYVEVQIDGMTGPPIGTLTPITRYYRFEEQYIGIAKLHCYHTNGLDVNRTIFPVYLTGSRDDGSFTAYFTDTVQTPGRPIHKVVMSGKMTERGIENYRYGYKIVEYLDDEIPINAYPLNSKFVFEDADGLADYDNWHD
jgi:hypothetical protein